MVTSALIFFMRRTEEGTKPLTSAGVIGARNSSIYHGAATVVVIWCHLDRMGDDNDKTKS